MTRHSSATGAVLPCPKRKSPHSRSAPGAARLYPMNWHSSATGAVRELLPVLCTSCGSPAVDNQSHFCTRCGTTFEQKPVLQNINCPSCGAPAPQGQSVYCNRCGTPLKRLEVHAAYQPGQAPVIVTQRKPAGSPPAVIVPETDWEPWNDVPPAPLHSGIPGPAMPKQSEHHDQLIAVPQKRYAHLPLVADEMRKKGEPGSRQYAPDFPDTSQKKKTVSQKKGVLGFLKK